jgi:hypothetical protein
MINTYRSNARTLHEYRLRYPWTAPVPTLTQSRMLGCLLEKHTQMENARRARQARLRAIGFALLHPWRSLAGDDAWRPR